MGYSHIQIPPDSTGKKIVHVKRLNMEVSTLLVNLLAIERGSPVVGNTSGASGIFVGTHVEFGETYIHIADSLGTFLVDEQLYINGIDSVTIDSFAEQYTPAVAVTDRDYLHHTLKISHEGSAYTRYKEGDLGFDAFGKAQFSQTTQMDYHSFIYGDTAEKYYDRQLNSGTITFNTTGSEMVLSTNSSSGSMAQRTTHQYYPYNPGEGNEMLVSLRIGDNGKTGLVRRWGLYDDEDGLFFELDGTTRSLVIRSSASGTVVDTKVTDSDFNGDPLDNENTSKFLINPTNYNLYWLDYQWLGVGRVRFGVIAPDGSRVTLHTFENPNAHMLPYMKRGTLPFRIEQYNSASTISSSEMRMACATIARQSECVQYQGAQNSFTSPLVAISGSVFTPIISSKPQVIHNGITNRVTLMPTDMEVTNLGDPIELKIITNSGLTGATYLDSGSLESPFLIDTTATVSTGGTRKESIFCGSGNTHRELEESLQNTLKLSADGVSQPIFTIAAKTVNPLGNADVSVLFRWKEVH